MGNYFRLCVNAKNFSRIGKTPRISKQRKLRASSGKLVLSQKALCVSLMAVLVSIVLMYVVQINTSVTKGFEIRDLEKKIAELQKQQKQLQDEAADLQSIQNIEEKINVSNYIPTTNVSYIHESGFAQR